MDKKPKDRHLDVPAEANRDKHVNFIAEENGETDSSSKPSKADLAERSHSKKKQRRRN